MARRLGAVRPVVESLEGRQLLAGNPLAFQNVVQTLPYVLNFQGGRNGVFDKGGLGTGFTLVQPNKNGTQYKAGLIQLNIAAKQLSLTTQGTATSGSNFEMGSSRVDLQACKLEYSIVSPK